MNLMKDEILSVDSYLDISDDLEAYFEAGAAVRMQVTGTSMYPLFAHRRDSVSLRKHDFYTKGDVVFYRRSNGSFVLHRIVGRCGDGFVMCGDWQYVKEKGITNEMILAKLVSFERKGKASTTDGFFYKLYSFLWMSASPLRPFILRLASYYWRIGNWTGRKKRTH